MAATNCLAQPAAAAKDQSHRERRRPA